MLNGIRRFSGAVKELQKAVQETRDVFQTPVERIPRARIRDAARDELASFRGAVRAIQDIRTAGSDQSGAEKAASQFLAVDDAFTAIGKAARELPSPKRAAASYRKARKMRKEVINKPFKDAEDAGKRLGDALYGLYDLLSGKKP